MHSDKLERRLAAAEIKPHVIRLEAHPCCTEKEIMGRLAECGTVLTGWYPLCHGDADLPCPFMTNGLRQNSPFHFRRS